MSRYKAALGGCRDSTRYRRYLRDTDQSGKASNQRRIERIQATIPTNVSDYLRICIRQSSESCADQRSKLSQLCCVTGIYPPIRRRVSEVGR